MFLVVAVGANGALCCKAVPTSRYETRDAIVEFLDNSLYRGLAIDRKQRSGYIAPAAEMQLKIIVSVQSVGIVL